MCQSLYVDGRELTGMAELRRLVGRRNVVIKPGHPSGTKNRHVCLCPVDLQATAERAGYKVVADKDNDPWGPTWQRP